MALRKGHISKKTLEPLISKRLSTREIGRRLGRKQTSVRYWLRKYGLATNPGYHNSIQETPKKCGTCGETNQAHFYGNKRSVCSTCHNRYTLRVGQKKRDKALRYLGDKCIACGYKKFSSALDIHHLDPKTKDSKFHGMRGWSWERIEKEIQGCVLLCKNCHGAYHAGEAKINFTGL